MTLTEIKSRCGDGHSVLLFLLLAVLLALALPLSPLTIAHAGISNGQECTQNSDCNSGYCYPGPPRVPCESPPKKYCIAQNMNCAYPGTDGAIYNQSYEYGTRKHICLPGGQIRVVDGQICDNSGADGLQCASGYCNPGPHSEHFCLNATLNCAQPDSAGALFGTRYTYDGAVYECRAGVGLVEVGIANGFTCTSGSECQSGYCYPGPGLDGQRYCLDRNKNCAWPGTDGVMFGEPDLIYNDRIYSCVSAVGLVDNGPVAGPCDGYGAESYTGAPIGGGPGYSSYPAAITTVSSADLLKSEVENGYPGKVVYISDNAEINLDLIKLPITVPAGVTIASERGKNGSNGALLFTNNLGACAFNVVGSDVRMTGFRLRGPDRYIRASSYCTPNSNGITVKSANLTIDNCELAQWSHAAIYLQPSASGAIIHHNNFHHNRRYGLGYSVVIDSVFADIYANAFDWGRHAIAATGQTGSGYMATYNLLGPMFFLTAEKGSTDPAYTSSYMFDMHDSGNNHGGMVIDILHNSFYGEGYLGAIHIEGIPDSPSTVAANYFHKLPKDRAVSQRVDQSDRYENFLGLSVTNNKGQFCY